MRTEILILNLDAENSTFNLSLLNDNKEFYWTIKIDEGDGNPILYSDYCSNKKIYKLYEKLKEYFIGTEPKEEE